MNSQYGQSQYGQSQYGQSQYGQQNVDFTESRNMGGGGYRGGASTFDPKQSQFQGSDTEVRGLFDAFQRNGKVDLREFLDILTSTGVNKKCSILIDKINNSIENDRVREVDFSKFATYFHFNLADRNDFMYTFKAIDKSQSFSIGPLELEEASRTYDLNLKKDDIRLMIDNLKHSNPDSVTYDELYNALYKQS